MKLLDVVREVRQHLEENGRVSLRMLRRQYELDDEMLDELVEELVDVQRVARREENVLVWAGPARLEPAAPQVSAPSAPPPARRQAAQAETRKVISIIFADLMGSTALQERLDPESVNRIMDAYYQAVRGPVEAGGGTVVQLLGDGVLCAFGIPTIGEDDALRAVRASVEVQQAFREFLATQQGLSVPIGLRVAVNTGEVVVSDEHPAGIGDPLNVAARLQQEARDGEVLIGQATRRLVGDAVTLEQAGVFALKGRAETVTAYRVMSLERPTGAAAAAFVGRTEELARITAVYEAALAAPAARLAVLVASPGQGKSRLIEEVSGRLADAATVVTAHCDAVGGATFAPMAEALRGWLASRSADPSDASDRQASLAAALPEGTADRERILAGITALLAGSPASPEETFFVIRRLLTALGQEKPVVLVIDDLHWAEPLLLDLVEHLIQWGSGVPLFVLIGARPELRELRSSLVTPGGLVADVLMLSGLDAGAAMRLAANVIGASDLPAAVAAKVLATSEGNPLFVGELVRMLVDEGAIEQQGERWVVGANLAALEMPPTIHALLAARIERLRPEERSVLERAAVVGRHFSRGAVAALLGHNGTELDARLEALRRTELIERDAGWFLGEPVLRFHHVLIRDAAYRRLLKGTRAELHQRLAEWIEARASDVAEHDETIGWHLEQAHILLRELGPLDAAGRALGERAARHLADAGRRALARDDLPVAADLLGRAVDRLDADDVARADLALDWCEALLSAGDVSRAAGAIAELGRFVGPAVPAASDSRSIAALDRGSHPAGTAGPIPDSRLPTPETRLSAWHTCFTAQLTVLTAPQELQTAADSVAAAAQQLAALGDAAGEAKAHSVNATALARLGKVGACEAALDQALAAARRGGDRRRSNAVLAGAPLAALWGPSPVTRASGRCLDVVRVLRITQGAPAVESVALSCQGVLEALRGRTEAARRMLASSRKMVEDLGMANRLFEADAFAGRIAAMEGDDATAERLLRSAYEGLRDLGLGIDAARAGALLARALLAQDRIAEAEALSHESEALAGDDLQAAIAWRGVRAEALAKRGEHAAAVELAKAAVAIASATDALLDHADARVALATALRAAGRGTEAGAEERRAIELWETKGATLLVERARRGVERIEAVVRTAGRGQARDPRTATTVGAPGLAAEASSVRGAPETTRPTPGRRVRANAAARNAARLTAALGATDLYAAEQELGDSVHVVHHPSGLTYDRPALLESFRRTTQNTKGLAFRLEALATLGDTLCLYRQWLSFDSADEKALSYGATEIEWLMLGEVDATGRRSGTEVFAADHLADAIARLYARHAELLPEGPERERAAATARSVNAMLTEPDAVDRVATVIAPDFESIDHRPLSTWSMRGGSAFLEHLRALAAVAADVVIPVQDVLGLGPNALLTRRLHSGTERVGGGAYERSFLVLFVTDADGRLARAEWFDAEREAEALARFDEIVASAAPKRSVRRRVRANAATAMQDRFDRALAARDFDAVAAAFAADHQEIDHPTGSTYGRDACIASLQRLFRSRQPYYDVERLATLGERLLLIRRRTGASGAAGQRYDVGAYENEALQLFEANEAGLCRSEVFAADHLGQALARLYQRYAQILPEGPQHARAAAVAQFATLQMAGPAVDLVPLARVLAPDFEGVDHRHLSTWSVRGAEPYLEHLRALTQVGDDIVFRHSDILALEPGAYLCRVLHSGTERVGGGAYERAFLSISAADAAGRLARMEWFDDDREAEALARFEEIVAGAQPQPSVRRRVRANAATRQLEREYGAIAARDADALSAVNSGIEVINHTTGATYGAIEIVAMHRGLWRGANLRTKQEILATLGDRLALVRRWALHDGVEMRIGSVGPVEFEYVNVLEVDERNRAKRMEVFAADRLGDALERLYQRYAEILPEGPARTRATGVARTVAAWNGPLDLDDLATVYAPSSRTVDHRFLGTWSAHDTEEILGHFRLQLDLAPDFAARYEDILAAAADSLAARVTFSGIARDSGGPFENRTSILFRFDADGRLSGGDVFEAEQEAEALARFDAVIAAPNLSVRRRVRANAATRGIERFQALITARDGAALADVFAESLAVLHHPTRATYGRREMLGVWRSIMKAERREFRSEILASLGDRFALERHFLSIEGLSEAHLAGFGQSDFDEVVLIETDERGRWVHCEIFAADRLRAAITRLYERYAESLPEGAARALAGGAAGSSAAFDGALDADRIALAHTPSFECVDHRTLGTWSAKGRDEYLCHWRGQADLATRFTARDDDVLALTAAAFAVRMTFFGTSRASGGAFENVVLVVSEFGADGLFTHTDLFEPEQEAEALTRFDEIVGGEAATQPEPFANAASRTDAELFRCFNGRDWEGVLACIAPVMVFDERRRLLRNTCGRDVWLEQFRFIFDVPNSHFTSRLRATRGERLALNFQRFEGEVAEGGGPLAVDDHFVLHEVDADGLIVAIVLFDLEDEVAAHAELDARFIAGEGAAHSRTLDAIDARRRAFASGDWDTWAALHAPDATIHDRRILGLMGTIVRGREALIRAQQVLVELAPDVHFRLDHLRLAPGGFLTQLTRLGSREGGTCENALLQVNEVDEDGRIRSYELYDPERLDLALTRFEELARGSQADPPPHPFENVATRAERRLMRCFNTRDWAGVEACFGPDVVVDERRRLLRTTTGPQESLASFRFLFDVPGSRFTTRLLATRGELLSLHLNRFEGEVADGGGPLAMVDHLALHQVGRDGRAVATVIFDVEDEAAAHAELDARFAAGEGALHARASAWVREFQRAFAARDWAAMAALHGPDQIAVNHRTVGWGTLRGPGAWVTTMEALVELAADAQFRLDHLRTCERGIFWQSAWQGTREGGRFETPLLVATELDDLGRQIRMDVWDADVLEPARARFEEMSAGGATPLGFFVNAAARAERTLMRCFAARDWAGVEACAAAELVFDDRQPLRRLTADRQEWRTMLRVLFDVPSARFETRLLATRGERLSLHANRFEGDVADGGGPLALDDHLALYEIDRDGRIVAVVLFAEGDVDAAHAELDARFEAGEGISIARIPSRFTAGVAKRDWAALTAICSPELVEHDHRAVIGLEPTRGAENWVQKNLRVYIELAPDTVCRSFHIRANEGGWFVQFAWEGTREGGRYEISQLAVIEQDERDRSRMLRVDVYDLAQLDLARARFAELAAHGQATGGAPAAPFANAATRAVERGTAALAARDWEAFAALMAPELRHYDRTRVAQLETPGGEWLASFRQFVEMTAEQPKYELLATRGERLALFSMLWRGAGGDVGPSEIDWRLIVEVNDREEHIAIVTYDSDRLDAAYDELDARFEAGEGASHPWGHSRRTIETRDWEAFAALMAPDLAYRDHRLLGWGTVRDVATFVRVVRSAVDLAPDARYRDDHVRLAERGALTQTTLLGTREGGAFENPMLRVSEHDELGRIRAFDTYDVEDLDRALARFAELEMPATSSERFANAATATVAPVIARIVAHDWRGFEKLFAESFRMSDRRRVVQLDLDRDRYVAFTREIADGRAIRARSEIVATRGERLALTRSTFEFTDGDVGPSEVAFLLLTQIDERGRIVAYVRWDLEDVEAAYAEIDARWAADCAGRPLPDPPPAAGGGRSDTHQREARWLAGYLDAFARRDWTAMTALFAPDLVGENHRLVGWGTRQGPEGLVSTLRAQIDLAPDTQERVDHVRTCDGAVLFEYAWHGTVEGGAFENVWLVLVELSADGRACRADVWEPEQLEQARARFDAIAARATATLPFENAASRAWREAISALRDRDAQRFAALHPPALRYRDHRRLVQLDLDRDGFLAFARPLLEMRSTSAMLELLATRGERLALMRSTLEIAEDSVGPSAVESLFLIETDTSGAIAAYDRYEIDDQDAARTEIETRWQTGEGALHPHATAWNAGFEAASNHRDFDTAATFFAPAFVGQDHRLVSWGTLHGPAGFLVAVRALVELAPDVRIRTHHLRASSRALLVDKVWSGTRDGGAFENPFLGVIELDGSGRALRMDLYNPHHLEPALARFAEVRDGESPTAGTRSNAATAAIERMWVFDISDPDVSLEALDAARAFVAPDFVWEDRRPMMRLSGGLDLMIASLRERVVAGARPERRTIVGTAGDRIAVARVLWAGGPPDGRFEVEFLAVHEVNEAGLHTANVFFDVADEEGAKREAWTRWAAIDPVAAPWVERLAEITEAWNSRDRVRLRAGFTENLVVEDHRHTGFGRIEGVDAYIESNVALWDLATDQRVEFGLSLPAVDRHGFVATVRREGTIPDGGPFESEYLMLQVRDGRSARVEFFEIDALDRALARFEELRPDSPTIPAATEHFENAASRAWRAVIAVWHQRDVERFATLHPPTLRYRDHRHLVQLDLDLDGFLAFTRPLLEMRSIRATLGLVATRGERLALMRSTLEMADDSVGPSAIESLILVETDERDDIVAYDRYDIDDEENARAELQARWDSGEGAHLCVLAWMREHRALLERRDWEALATHYGPAVVGHDHRLVGWGTLRGPEEFIKSLRSMVELSADARLTAEHTRACDRGFLFASRWVGTRDGGAFESSFLTVMEFGASGGPIRVDFYDAHHFERAQGRFAEIRDGEAPVPSVASGPSNAATEAIERLNAAFDTGSASGDWDPLREICAAGFVWGDERRLALLRGDLELMIAAARERVAMGARPEASQIIGTAGERVAAERLLWAGGPSDGRFEIEYIRLAEVDEAGQLTAMILFDIDDERAAQREAWSRWAAIDPVAAPWVELVSQFTESWNVHDRARVRACFADDFILEDHRHAGLGTIEGAEAYVDSIAVLWDLAPDQRVGFGWSWPVVERQGIVLTGWRGGTLAEGRAFANDYTLLYFAKAGRFTRWELFEIEALEPALARFEELRPDPLRVPPNAATRANDRQLALAWAKDWEGVRAMHSPRFVFEDRRKGLHTTVDGEAYVAGLRWARRPDVTHTLLATAGDRLALRHNRFSRTKEGTLLFEVDTLALSQVDADGRLEAIVLFDADDRAAADAELTRRYLESDAHSMPPAVVEFGRAINAHDLARARAALPDDFVLDDHRRIGLGRIEGADAYIASFAALDQQSKDARVGDLYRIADAAHGHVVVSRVSGTNLEGGDFEIIYVRVVGYRDGRAASIEFFELDDLDAALARFEELRPVTKPG